MSAKTISVSLGSAVTLSATYSYTTILASGGVSVASGAAVVGATGTVWSLGNAGTLIGLSGAVSIAGGLDFYNSGRLAGSVPLRVAGVASVLNTGSIGSVAGSYEGVLLDGGGTITNAAPGYVGGHYFGVRFSNPALLVNAGTVSGALEAGIGLGNGGTIDNSGTIRGYSFAVSASGAPATILNSGTIETTNGFYAGAGIDLKAGGSVTNQAGGTIFGNAQGVVASAGSTIVNAAGGSITGGNVALLLHGGSLVNAGDLAGGYDGVLAYYLLDPAVITNAPTGTITGPTGVTLRGTILEAGTIIATNTTGVAIGIVPGYLNADVAIAPGAVIQGGVNGGNAIGSSYVSMLEFTAGTAAGTFAGLGSHYTNFATVRIDSNANWTAASGTLTSGQLLADDGTLTLATDLGPGTIAMGAGATLAVAAGYTLAATLDFFGTGDALVLDGVSATAKNDAGGYLTVSAATGNLTLAIPGPFATNNFTLATGGGNTTITANPTPTTLTIATALTTAVTLSANYTYTTITAPGGSINSGTAAAVIGVAGKSWSLGNGGVLRASAATGVTLASGGTLANSGGIYGRYAIQSGGPLTLANSGMISASGKGIVLAAGGSIANAGTIEGYVAVTASPAAATLVNAGLIASTSNYNEAVEFPGGGIVTNTAGGTIVGGLVGVYGVGVTVTNDAGGTIAASDTANLGFFRPRAVALRGGSDFTNFGRVTGTAEGILLDASRVTNEAGGTLAGGVVAGIYGTGTVVNAGLIDGGTSGYAISFTSTYANRLVVEPGASFAGAIDGGNTLGAPQSSTLELAPGGGTLAGFGASVRDFATISLDPGAAWLLAGTPAGLGGGEAITGFAPGATIELTGTVESETGLTAGSLTLSGGTTLDLPGLGFANVTNNGADTFITACFAAGTRILTRLGPRAVETLRHGDRVLAASGRLAAIRWLGHRRTDPRRHPDPHAVMPVRVRAGALGPNLPARDLILSPDHAVFLAGALVPIRHLANGKSIVQEIRDSVTYWHVELHRHEVILAEGLPCESYLDTGNRTAFENNPGPVQLHPDFARRVWDSRGCAPILTDPADPMLRHLHTSLLARAAITTSTRGAAAETRAGAAAAAP
jgi:hypothetical protein